MSNWELKTSEEEFDLNDIIKKTKDILRKMSVKDFVIMLLILMMFLIYVVHINAIDNCNFYYQSIIRNMTQLTTSLW